SAVDTDPDMWKKRLAGTHLERLERLREIRAADGKPAIDETPLNEWLYWDTLGERDPGFDITVTNQLIASVEYNGADIHTALRGGLLLGTTSYARHGALGAQFWWSVFPFLSADVQIAAMRGGEHYAAEEAALLAGTLAAHELGHLLFRYGHPFNVHACIMSPTPMLRFREAVRLLDAAACRAANDPAMAAGVIDLRRPEGVQ
ncbi:MAG TPA: hypothetical protein VFV17_05430, partial [Usitatibacteraceae bacterium]|nr:hypothetical protein [Usitatibacteraceae bacterium]